MRMRSSWRGLSSGLLALLLTTSSEAGAQAVGAEVSVVTPRGEQTYRIDRTH